MFQTLVFCSICGSVSEWLMKLHVTIVPITDSNALVCSKHFTKEGCIQLFMKDFKSFKATLHSHMLSQHVSRQNDVVYLVKQEHLQDTAPQHLVCRVVQSLHTNHMQMSIVEVFICRRLHMNTSMIPVCIWLICRLCTALHTKCCGAVRDLQDMLDSLLTVF